MDAIVIEGGVPLKGRVRVSGAKNAALPILAATLLMEGEVRLEGVPDLRDIRTMLGLLQELGSAVERNADGTLSLTVTDESAVEAPYKVVKEMRASFCVLGPLLARRGRAKVSMPGGCNLGVRPVDLHLKGLRALGAKIAISGGDVQAEGRLTGDEIFLSGAFGSTVLGTANVMMAATLALGRTIIEGAACEPEVSDLARFLIACGAKIEGIGSHRIVIDGVERLRGTPWRMIPDRMEAGIRLWLVSLWEELRSIDIVLEEVAKEFDGEDPLRPIMRGVVEKTRRRLTDLHEVLSAAGEIELKEPDEEAMDLARTYFENGRRLMDSLVTR